jgi:hypothetical protein
MVAYHEVAITRSDGKRYFNHNGKVIPNKPGKKDRDRTPDAEGKVEYYLRLDSSNAKEIDWRRKLGGMLMREQGGKEAEGKTSNIV